jgi:heme-degrading monooxygenase HmoA
LIQIVWEFVAREDKVAEFENFYSATGSWATLFHESSGFLGTTLLRDTQTARRYLTIDRWESSASHQRMLERSASEYEATDRRCEALTESERQIGVFEGVGDQIECGRKCQRK